MHSEVMVMSKVPRLKHKAMNGSNQQNWQGAMEALGHLGDEGVEALYEVASETESRSKANYAHEVIRRQE